MSVFREVLENYADKVAILTADFIEEIDSYAEFDECVREKAEKFQENIMGITKYFIKGLKVTRPITRLSENIHETVVDYLLGNKEIKESHNLVSVKEILTEIEEYFISKFENFPTLKRTHRIYFPLIKKILEENIRKYRPDIFRMMNPGQKTLE